MIDSNKAFAAKIFAIWPLIILASLIFFVAKIIQPKLDWGVVFAATILLFVGFQLRSARKTLLSDVEGGKSKDDTESGAFS